MGLCGKDEAAARPKAADARAIHRTLHLVAVAAVSASELGKLGFSRWQNHGYGYWWVSTGGFSVGSTGTGGALLDAGAALLVTLVLLDLTFAALGHLSTSAWPALALHFVAAPLLCALAAADLALAVGAGGARVSLPLVLFALSEPGYVISVSRPWMHVLAASAVGVAVAIVVLGGSALALVRRVGLRCRCPLLLKLSFAVACVARLHVRRESAAGAGADMLSQLGIDAVAMLRGTLLTSPAKDILEQHLVRTSEVPKLYPPLLLYQWEAGGAQLLARAAGANRSATPFLHSLVERENVIATQAFVSVPMTLKSAWEVLCGVPPAFTSDFREHGSSLRRECLPRVLKRCCGYHSILAKTDTELPELPRRVFGFDEVIVAPTNERLLTELRARLASLGALEGTRPVFVYFYAGDAHAPYTPDRVDPSERGYVDGPVEDVFLALSRRADETAEQLSQFWPPSPPPGDGQWKPEHGLAIYFGDHGELLWEHEDPPPHGNSVSPDVSKVFVAVEPRAFASAPLPQDGRSGERRPPAGAARQRRLADIFATVTSSLGLVADGPLHVGESLLQEGHRQSTATFSFYRPCDLAAVHLLDAQGSSQTLQFARGLGGWVQLAEDGSPKSCGVGGEAEEGVGQCAAADDGHLQYLSDAIAARDRVNGMLTESNVYAAWMYARLQVAARHAKALLKRLLAAALPSPAQEDIQLTSYAEKINRSLAPVNLTLNASKIRPADA